MTVSNGDSANGESNGHTAAPVLEKGSWTVGLVNSRHKYLSAETFGFKINANGKTMKKKQVSVGELTAYHSKLCRPWLDILIGYNSLHIDPRIKSMGCFEKFMKFSVWI